MVLRQIRFKAATAWLFPYPIFKFPISSTLSSPARSSQLDRDAPTSETPETGTVSEGEERGGLACS